MDLWVLGAQSQPCFQGERFQHTIHQGGWQTDLGVAGPGQARRGCHRDKWSGQRSQDQVGFLWRPWLGAGISNLLEPRDIKVKHFSFSVFLLLARRNKSLAVEIKLL